MNLVYRWLQDYVKTTTPPEELGEKFRMTSSELEGVSVGYTLPEEVIVGHVLSLKKHPDADRLQVAQVKTGKETRTIVCGAPNIAEGQQVIVALPGAILHPLNSGEQILIHESVIRGVTSQGMCCSAQELGIASSDRGIIVLDRDFKPGTPATEALGFNDSILDLEITPNRPDLLSYRGLAREVAAFEKRSLLDIPIATLETGENKLLTLEGKIENDKLCSRYSLVALEVAAGKHSPWWLQSRLILAGVRPVNAVVDVANFVMLELGQPLHTFDLDTFPPVDRRSAMLHVREAHEKETIKLLDESTRSLEKGDVVISDTAGHALALAGIMGGESTAISDTTTRIVIEAATFNPASIRRTSRRLGLRSEASLRFEKGLDPELTVTALKRAVHLLQEAVGAKVISRLSDSYNRQHLPARPRISVSFNRIQQLLGIHMNPADCRSILQKLGFQLQSFTKSGFDATPPSWRPDVTLPEDVIEELIRIWGYERLPKTLPGGAIQAPEPNQRFELRKNIRHALAMQQAYELVSQPFVSARNLEQAGFTVTQSVTLPNPLSKETAHLIPSHLVTFLLNLSTANRESGPVVLFEIGKTFHHPSKEREVVSLLSRDNEMNNHQVQQFKSLIARMFEKASKSTDLTYAPTSTNYPYFAPGTSLSVHSKNTKLGVIGYIAPEILSQFKLRSGKALLFAEFDFEAINALSTIPHFYKTEPKFPGIERDITLIVAETTPYQDIADRMSQLVNLEITRDWYLASTYTGKPLNSNEVSFTLHLSYNAANRTLEDAAVQQDINRLIADLRKTLKATIND